MPREPVRPGEHVEAELRRRIDAGEWRRGQQLPSTAELAEQYHVARGTVVRAYRRLAEEGLVVVRPKWGTFKS